MPGSPLFAQARREGLELPEKYAGFSQHSYETLNLRNNQLTSAEILSFRDNAWDVYHTSDKYLSLMRGKFGDRAYNELKATKKIKLKRKLLEEANTELVL